MKNEKNADLIKIIANTNVKVWFITEDIQIYDCKVQRIYKATSRADIL